MYKSNISGQVIMNKFKELAFRFLEKDSGQTLRYRSINLTCALIHIFFIFFFAKIDVKGMLNFNVFSVIFYTAGIILAKRAAENPIWIILIYFEIVIHAVLCNFFLDWSYGFALYSLMVIPISYYLAYMHPKIEKPTRFSTILAVINISTMLITGFVARGNAAEHDVALSKLITFFNFLVSAIVITIFSSIYVYEIRGKLNDLSTKNNELNFLANYDALTKLRNRHHIADVFHIFEENTAPFCVFLGDIDDFKRINDTYSHDCGDKVLVSVADIISKNVGDKGVVCRWGGEEILVILSGKNEECLDLMEKTRLMIQNQRLSFNRKEIKVTMTFGFADYSEAMNIEKLVSIADSRLYYGKKNGKNQIVFQKKN